MTTVPVTDAFQMYQTENLASLPRTFSPASPVAPIVVPGVELGSASGSTSAVAISSFAGAALAGAARARAPTSANTATAIDLKLRALISHTP